MGVKASVGNSLLSLDELDDLSPRLEKQFSQEDNHESFALAIDDHRELLWDDLQRAFEAQSPTIPFEGIGLGLPLTIAVEHVYLGDYPDPMMWWPGAQKGDVIVTSAHKGFSVFGAAPRAVHMLRGNAARRRSLNVAATRQGSKLAYYSPAVTDDAIYVTIEIAVDRELDKKYGTAVGTAFTAAGALPVFAPAAPFLVVASAVIPIAESAAGMLLSPTTFFEGTAELNFNRPGLAATQAGSLLLYPDDQDDAFADFSIGQDFSLINQKGARYRGDVPYVTISLDGRARSEYETWSAHAASAALLERYFSGPDLISGASDIVTQGMSLYNDLTYYDRASALEKRMRRMSNPENIEKLRQRYEAYKANVKNEDLRSTLP